MRQFQIRQGDVALMPRERPIPSSAVEQEPDDRGKIILKFGEATGHHHFFTSNGGRIFTAPNGERYFRSLGNTPAGRVEGVILEEDSKSILLRPQGAYPIKFAKLHALVIDGGVVTNADWSLLSHQEHDGEAVPVGDYDLPNQREYSPEAIRNVQD